MISLQTLPTADLDPATRDELRALVFDAFRTRFEESHWEHALGGVHVLARIEGALVGHASVVGRRLLHGGRALRCGFVESVATAPAARGQGVAWTVMAEIERLVLGGHEVGALGASDAGRNLYVARGWVPWRGTLHALSPDGIRDTPEEVGTVHVLPGSAPLDVDASLTCDYREGDLW